MITTFEQDNFPNLIDCKEVAAVFLREDRSDSFYNPYKLEIVFKSGHIRTFCYKDPKYPKDLYENILKAKMKK